MEDLLYVVFSPSYGSRKMGSFPLPALSAMSYSYLSRDLRAVEQADSGSTCQQGSIEACLFRILVTGLVS